MLNRAHAYKAAVAANVAVGRDPDHGVNMGLHGYPLLIAADLLALDADEVPHPWSDRDTSWPRRPQDEQVLRKRHPADGGAGRHARQIGRIVTDSTPPGQPKDLDASTLVALLRAFAEPGTVAAVEERYRTAGIGCELVKERPADAIDAHVAPIRARYRHLLADPVELDARLADGEVHARRRADRTLTRTAAAMGL